MIDEVEMSSSNPKRALYAQFAAVAKAMAHEHRLELLELVAQGERSVEALAEPAGFRLPTRRSIFSSCDVPGSLPRDGTANLSSIGSPTMSVLTAVAAVHQVAERNVGEVDRIVRSYFHERDALEPVSRAELLAA